MTATGRALPASGPKLWLLVFSALFLIVGAWAFAAPHDGTPDENAHIFRAYGVASGDFVPKLVNEATVTGAMHMVPAGLLRDNCWKFEPQTTVACGPQVSADATLIEQNVLAGRYNPVYYALVGLPIKLWPGMGGIIGSRLLSAAGVAALLASAFLLMASSRRLLYAGSFAVAFTPMTAHMGGAVNPNGWEIAAGIAFFAAGIKLFLDRDEGDLKPAYWLLGISGSLLLMLRSAGVFLFLIALLVLLIPLSRVKVRELWRNQATRKIGFGWAGVGVIALGWLLLMRPNQLAAEQARFHYSAKEALRLQFEAWGDYLDQFVGVMAHLDTRAPSVFYSSWLFVAGFLILLALLTADRLGITRLLILFAGAVIVPTAIQLAFVNKAGFVTQGRYLLPLMVGFPMLSAFLVAKGGTFSKGTLRLTRLITLLIPLHTIFLVITMLRWQRGMGTGYNPLEGQWLPVAGPVLPLAMSAIGVSLLLALTWWLLRPQSRLLDASPGMQVCSGPVDDALEPAAMAAVSSTNATPRTP